MPSPPARKSLDDLFTSERVDFTFKSIESPQEIEARLTRAEEDGKHRRLKDLLLTGTGIIAIGIGLIAAIIVAIFPIGSPEDKAKAWTILIMVVAGFIGFLTGRQFPAESSSEGRR